MLCPSQQNTSFEWPWVSPLGQSFTGIPHRAWSWFPMGLVTVNEQTLASCLSSRPSPHGRALAGLRWLGGGGGESQYLEGKFKLPAQSKLLLRQRHPDSAPNTNPHSPCCRLQLEPEQTSPIRIIFKSSKETRVHKLQLSHGAKVVVKSTEEAPRWSRAAQK